VDFGERVLRQALVPLVLVVIGTAGGCARDEAGAQEKLSAKVEELSKAVEELSTSADQLPSEQKKLRQLIEEVQGDLEVERTALSILAEEVAELRAELDSLRSAGGRSARPVLDGRAAESGRPDAGPLDRWVRVIQFRVIGSGQSSKFKPPKIPWRVTTHVVDAPNNPAATKVQLMRGLSATTELKANESRVVEFTPDLYNIRVLNGEGGVIDFLVEYLERPK
jgi:outer membrane murein-binding lipoprotein Lpp